MNKCVYLLNINDLTVQASFHQKNIEEIFLPLLQQLTALQKQRKERIVVLLAAPCGAGKSTLANFLELLSNTYDNLEPLQAIQMDGFHYPNSYLTSHHIDKDPTKPLLKTIKGHPDSFDCHLLLEKVQQLKGEINWPIYSRKLHDVSSETIFIKKNIVLLEGNYLLLNQYPYNELKKYADYTIFIEALPEHLQTRLIQRKIQGGFDKQEATLHYQQVDKNNVILVLNQSTSADLTLSVDEDMFYRIKQTKK